MQVEALKGCSGASAAGWRPPVEGGSDALDGGTELGAGGDAGVAEDAAGVGVGAGAAGGGDGDGVGGGDADDDAGSGCGGSGPCSACPCYEQTPWVGF